MPKFLFGNITQSHNSKFKHTFCQNDGAHHRHRTVYLWLVPARDFSYLSQDIFSSTLSPETNPNPIKRNPFHINPLTSLFSQTHFTHQYPATPKPSSTTTNGKPKNPQPQPPSKNPQTKTHKNPQTQKTQTQTQESLDQNPKSLK